MTSLTIRWAINRDFPQIHDIERVTFLDAAMRPDQIVSLAADSRMIATVATEPGLFADEIVVGWCAVELAAHGIHIHRLAVPPAFRRQGIGTALVARAVRRLRGRRTEASVLVDEDMLATQLFFRAIGWQVKRYWAAFEPHLDGCGILEFTYRTRDIGAEVIERIWRGDARVLPCSTDPSRNR